MSKNENNPEVKGDKEKDKPKKIIKYYYLTASIYALLTVIFIILIVVCLKGYKYQRIYFVKDCRVDSLLDQDSLSHGDIVYLKDYLGKNYEKQVASLNQLRAEKVIITPEQYTSNLSDYYNGLIAVLSALLVILNVIAYFSLKTNAETELKSKISDIETLLNKKVQEQTKKLLMESEPIHNIMQASLVRWMEESDYETNSEKVDNIQNDLEELKNKYNDAFVKKADEELDSTGKAKHIVVKGFVWTNKNN